jgi:hypothetical protein
MHMIPGPGPRRGLRRRLIGGLAVALAAACAKTPKDSPSSGSRPELEAPGPAEPESRFAGTVGGHRFTITVDGGSVIRSGPEAWSWKIGAGEVSVRELGVADADTHYQVERSPRTIVRGDQEISIFTEVVLVAGGRVFRCEHEEPVEDPDSPGGKAAVDRGVAACTSLRVEP